MIVIKVHWSTWLFPTLVCTCRRATQDAVALTAPTQENILLETVKGSILFHRLNFGLGQKLMFCMPTIVLPIAQVVDKP